MTESPVDRGLRTGTRFVGAFCVVLAIGLFGADCVFGDEYTQLQLAQGEYPNTPLSSTAKLAVGLGLITTIMGEIITRIPFTRVK